MDFYIAPMIHHRARALGHDAANFKFADPGSK